MSADPHPPELALRLLVRDQELADAVRSALAPHFRLTVVDGARCDLALVDAGDARACELSGGIRGAAPILALGPAGACLEAVEAGANDWVTTPFEPGLLAHRVRTMLRAAQPAVAGHLPSGPREADRTALGPSLQRALQRGELLLHYQPRVELATGTVLAVEALLRWKHPELGLVSPARFIPLLEESGQIVEIGEWALREACRQNRAWRDAGLPHVRVAVNLSSVQFREPGLEGTIARVLEDTGLAPEGLELELTESMLLRDADATLEALHTIQSMGVHMSIDDFGTGYSSLSYVKRFPVDALKIDQSFVRDMTASPTGSAITTSIVLMGKSLGLAVVAEGVETRSQVEFLRVLECDEAQGYFFSRPVPAEAAAECIRTGFAALLDARTGAAA
ncbi:MAG: EAL domain-containing protein [Planctomycetes bacterium]|nr:EAL domain-containing protein [Planctomycetota bacterium]